MACISNLLNNAEEDESQDSEIQIEDKLNNGSLSTWILSGSGGKDAADDSSADDDEDEVIQDNEDEEEKEEEKDEEDEEEDYDDEEEEEAFTRPSREVDSQGASSHGITHGANWLIGSQRTTYQALIAMGFTDG